MGYAAAQTRVVGRFRFRFALIGVWIRAVLPAQARLPFRACVAASGLGVARGRLFHAGAPGATADLIKLIVADLGFFCRLCCFCRFCRSFFVAHENLSRVIKSITRLPPVPPRFKTALLPEERKEQPASAWWATFQARTKVASKVCASLPPCELWVQVRVLTKLPPTALTTPTSTILRMRTFD